MGRSRQDWILKFKQEALRNIGAMQRHLQIIREVGIDPTVPRRAEGDQPRVDGDENLRELYRLAHSIKGSASMVGLDEIEALAAQMEVTLGAVYYNPASFKPNLVAEIEAAIVSLEALLAAIP